MDRQIRDAAFVLMICTEPYFKPVSGTEEPGVGHGVRWEGTLIYQHIYNTGTLNERFVPVVFSDDDARFVPTPMQGATVYNLAGGDGYERLYGRLTGQGRVARPPLGERRPPLPARPVKTDPSMYLTGPIDIGLWNRARWSGAIFMWAPDLPPVLGLAFQDAAAGREIFETWRERYGERDAYEELRVAVIEGDVPAEPPGYSVHIGTEPDAAVRRFRAAGFDADPTLLAMITRIQRMTPSPNAENLLQFKRHFEKWRSYLLAPGAVSANMTFRPMLDLAIAKGVIHLRHVQDIGPNDLDAAVLQTGKSIRPEIACDRKK
jgi:hypothetical protein